MFSNTSAQTPRSGLRLAVLVLLFLEIFFGAVVSGFAGQARGLPIQPAATNQVSAGLREPTNMLAQMAVLCVGKAVHIDLRHLCEQMLDGRTGETLVIRDRLQNWHEVSTLPVLMADEQGRLEKLKNLNAEAFEVEWMTLMLQSNAQVSTEVHKCQLTGSQTDAYVACRLATSNLQAEVAQIRTWLCEWYGDCRAR